MDYSGHLRFILDSDPLRIMTDLSDLITISQLASRMKVTRQYVSKKIKDDQAKFGDSCLVKLGRKYYEVVTVAGRPLLRKSDPE